MRLLKKRDLFKEIKEIKVINYPQIFIGRVSGKLTVTYLWNQRKIVLMNKQIQGSIYNINTNL